jgi:hypothetical protein
VRLGDIEARSRYAPSSCSPPFAIICGHTYPPDDPITTTPNHDGLQFAKPNLQSVFKKPGRATAEP